MAVLISIHAISTKRYLNLKMPVIFCVKRT
jgi:hypothetical protein